jgi:hypothetical protein
MHSSRKQSSAHGRILNDKEEGEKEEEEEEENGCSPERLLSTALVRRQALAITKHILGIRSSAPIEEVEESACLLPACFLRASWLFFFVLG